jgi:hypothetical protein
MNSVSLECRIDVFEAPERERYAALRSAMKAAVRGVEELPDGYALRLTSDADVFGKVAEWITLERRCCPFLTVALRWAETDTVSLELTGSAEVKAFLASRLA